MSATTHVRQHNSMLAAAERRALIWIAERLPRWINSDHLSALGLAAMAGAGVSFCVAQADPVAGALLVVLCLLLNWFGDSLDGTVARVRDQQRPRYGYYVDHVIDLAGTAALIGGMAASGLMTPSIALALVAAYYLVSAETFLATHSVGVFRLSFAGFGPTELRILLAIGAFSVARNPYATIAGHRALLLDVGAIVATGSLAAVFVISAIRNASALYQQEPLPRREDAAAPRAFRSAALSGETV